MNLAIILIAPKGINTPASGEFNPLIMTFNPAHNISRTHRARLACYFFAVDEQCQRGDAADVEACA